MHVRTSHTAYFVFVLFCKDGGDEVIFSWWSSDEPNNYNNACVCVDPSGDVAWKWTDCSCTVSRQFICLKSRKRFYIYVKV